MHALPCLPGPCDIQVSCTYAGHLWKCPTTADAAAAAAQVMMYNTYRDGMDVMVKHLVPDKLPQFVLQKALDAQQAAKAITQAAEVLLPVHCFIPGLACVADRRLAWGYRRHRLFGGITDSSYPERVQASTSPRVAGRIVMVLFSPMEHKACLHLGASYQ